MKTSGLVDIVRSALAPMARKINAAFVFGSVAKAMDTVTSDIDLLVVSDTLSYGELFTVLEPATNRSQRTVNPTLYSRAEIGNRRRDPLSQDGAPAPTPRAENAFVCFEPRRPAPT